MTNKPRTFDGKYVRIDYNDRLTGVVTITRKSSGQEFPIEARDVAGWIVQMIRERQLVTFAGDLARGARAG
jgi:hypothetical protein